MPPFIQHEPFNERVELPNGGHLDLRVPKGSDDKKPSPRAEKSWGGLLLPFRLSNSDWLPTLIAPLWGASDGDHSWCYGEIKPGERTPPVSQGRHHRLARN